MNINQAKENIRIAIGIDTGISLVDQLKTQCDLIVDSLYCIQDNTRGQDKIDFDLAGLLYELGVQSNQLMMNKTIDHSSLRIEQISTLVDVFFHMGRIQNIKNNT